MQKRSFRSVVTKSRQNLKAIRFSGFFGLARDDLFFLMNRIFRHNEVLFSFLEFYFTHRHPKTAAGGCFRGGFRIYEAILLRKYVEFSDFPGFFFLDSIDFPEEERQKSRSFQHNNFHGYLLHDKHVMMSTSAAITHTALVGSIDATISPAPNASGIRHDLHMVILITS